MEKLPYQKHGCKSAIGNMRNEQNIIGEHKGQY